MKIREFMCDEHASRRRLSPKDKTVRPRVRDVACEYCEWEYREGMEEGDHFAYTPCLPGFNYLGKSSMESLKEEYTKRKISCPICGKIIRLNFGDEK